MAAIPVLGEVRDALAVIPGSVPDLINLPPGCKFSPRCPYVKEICTQQDPPLVQIEPRPFRCAVTCIQSRRLRRSGQASGGPTGALSARKSSSRNCDGVQEGQEMAATTDATHKDMLVVDNLKKYFPVRSGLLQRVTAWVKAVDECQLHHPRGRDLRPGGRVGLRQDHGRTHDPAPASPQTAGRCHLRRRGCLRHGKREFKALRRNMQIVFQDPYSSLDPRMPVGEIIAEGLLIHGIGNRQRAQRRP